MYIVWQGRGKEGEGNPGRGRHFDYVIIGRCGPEREREREREIKMFRIKTF